MLVISYSGISHSYKDLSNYHNYNGISVIQSITSMTELYLLVYKEAFPSYSVFLFMMHKERH
jgi:hypothetical protein